MWSIQYEGVCPVKQYHATLWAGTLYLRPSKVKPGEIAYCRITRGAFGRLKLALASAPVLVSNTETLNWQESKKQKLPAEFSLDSWKQLSA